MTLKEIDRARRTHQLKTAEGGTCQDTERNRPSEWHSQTEDSRGRDLSGHRKNPTERRALTSWRRQREGLVRTPKEIDRARGTHKLKTAERGTCQDAERNQLSEGHSLPGDGRGRDLSGYGRNRAGGRHSLSGDGRGRDLSGHEPRSTERGALTSWRWQREGLVRILKETDRERGAHFLETGGGGTCQATERNQLSKGHSLPGDGRGRDFVMTPKEIDRARGTH